MIPELLWIIGFYVAAAAFVHGMARREWGGNRLHYVLIAGNNERQIEGYIRELQRFSLRTGTEIGITVVLDQSTDETKGIMERFMRADVGINWVNKEIGDRVMDIEVLERERFGAEARGYDGAKAKVVWVELASLDDRARLPI